MKKMTMTRSWAAPLAFLLAAGCSATFLSPRRAEVKRTIAQAEYLAGRGDYRAAIAKYEQTLDGPAANPWQDKVLFNLGCLRAAVDNPDRDFAGSLSCFRRLKEDHPRSRFNAQSQVWFGLLEGIVSLEDEVRSGRAELAQSRLLLEQGSAQLEAERREREASRSAELLQTRRVKELEGQVETQKAALESLERQLRKMKEIDIQAEKKAKGIK